jgi:hypothetical protein
MSSSGSVGHLKEGEEGLAISSGLRTFGCGWYCLVQKR